MSPSDQEIVDYLKNHPEFFLQHPEFKVSSSPTSVVSLTERQLPVLRDKIRHLEEQLGDLLDAAHDNEHRSAKVQQLAVWLLSHREHDNARTAMLDEMKSLFAIEHATMRFWNHALEDDSQPVLEDFRSFIAELQEPFCGEHPLYEVNRWFGEHAHDIHSYAVAAIGAPAFGVLVLGDAHPERFNSSQGTLFLKRVTELLAAALQGHKA
jgi:uncharacterized protein YigA (DUF484 family)